MFESYSDYKLNHRSVVKRTSLQPICSLNEMTRLWIFDKKIFFPNLELLNSGCGLSASAAHTPVFTVFEFVTLSIELSQTFVRKCKNKTTSMSSEYFC